MGCKTHKLNQYTHLAHTHQYAPTLIASPCLFITHALYPNILISCGATHPPALIITISSICPPFAQRHAPVTQDYLRRMCIKVHPPCTSLLAELLAGFQTEFNLACVHLLAFLHMHLKCSLGAATEGSLYIMYGMGWNDGCSFKV